MTEIPAAEPSQPPAVADITLGDADLVDFGGAPAPRKHRRTVIVSSVAAVLVAVGGVGAYAGVRAWTGSSIVEPEAAMPASTAAFLRVDLKPGYRDQIAFDGLAKKFPGRGSSTTDLVTKVERQMLEGSPLRYDTDVAPWFGQRAGIGAYADRPDHVVGLIALASTDDAKAKQALGKVSAAKPGNLGYVVRNGYALIAVGGSDPQAVADQASKAAATANLADDKAFHAAISHLPGNNLVIGYGDLGKIGPLASNAISGALASGGADRPGLPGPAGLLSGLGTPTTALAKATGHVAIGIGVVSDGVEVHVHTDGTATKQASSVNAKSTLDAMPDSAVVALATRGLDKDSASVKSVTALLEKVVAGSRGADSKDPVRQAVHAQLDDLVTNLLTAKVISLEFGGVASGGTPNLVVAADTGDATTATSLMQGLGLLVGFPGVQVKQDGTTVRATVGTPQTGGKLGDSSLYQEAMKGAGNSSMAAYIDVQKLLRSTQSTSAVPAAGGSATANVAPIKAVGITSSVSGGSSDLLIRIVIK